MRILITQGAEHASIKYDLKIRPEDTHPFKFKVLSAEKASIFRGDGVLFFSVDEKTVYLVEYDPVNDTVKHIRVYSLRRKADPSESTGGV